MARKKTTTNNTSTSQRTVAEIKEAYDRIKKKHDEAKGLQLRDLQRSSTKTISSYDRERIRAFLQAPGSNEDNLRKAARYLYYRSQIFFRIINFYASMWMLNARQVIPNYDLTKAFDQTKALKNYNDTLDALNIYNIQNNIYEVLVRCYLEDVCYSLFFHDETGSFYYILEPENCKIIGRYYTGDFMFAIKMSAFRGSTNQSLIEWIGEPLASMYKAYESTNETWQIVPEEYAACFKFRRDTIDAIIPPMAQLLQQLAGLNDLEDIQAISDEASIYKLLVFPMKILSGAKDADDFEISPDLFLKYFDKMIDEALPDYVTAAPMPGSIPEVISFSDSAADKDVDRYQQSQNNILATAGGGALLNATMLNSTYAFKMWLKEETSFAISSLMPQIEGWTNRMLMYEVSNPCQVKYFPVSIYIIDEFREKLLESCQYGYNNKIFYNTLLGIDEKATLSMSIFEVDVLKLPDLLKHPLSSSYTSTGQQDAGRPTEDDSNISDSGERSRNA